jgi:diguanylate cyclase (GGDEF)-like protein
MRAEVDVVLSEQPGEASDAERRHFAATLQSASLGPDAAMALHRARFAIGTAQRPRDVVDAVIALVRALGGHIAPVGIAPEDALPWNLTLGVDEAMRASSEPGSKASEDLRLVLPALLDDARREVIRLRQKALRRDPNTSDEMTGLVNRAAFAAELRQLEPRAAVALVQLHDLQLLTDNAGTAASGAVLVAFARLLTDHVRPSDIAARYSDDTFGLALPGITVRSLALRLELIRQAWNGLRPYTVAFSVGVAALDSTPKAALIAAAEALDLAALDRQ